MTSRLTCQEQGRAGWTWHWLEPGNPTPPHCILPVSASLNTDLFAQVSCFGLVIGAAAPAPCTPPSPQPHRNRSFSLHFIWKETQAGVPIGQMGSRVYSWPSHRDWRMRLCDWPTGIKSPSLDRLECPLDAQGLRRISMKMLFSAPVFNSLFLLKFSFRPFYLCVYKMTSRRWPQSSSLFIGCKTIFNQKEWLAFALTRRAAHGRSPHQLGAGFKPSGPRTQVPLSSFLLVGCEVNQLLQKSPTHRLRGFCVSGSW